MSQVSRDISRRLRDSLGWTAGLPAGLFDVSFFFLIIERGRAG